jgi:TPR repeat protein
MRCLIVAALAVILALPVAAQGFQKGCKAYQRGEFATALSEWRPLAGQGDAATPYKLGKMYSHGKGVPQNNREAIKWYLLAAEQGAKKLPVKYT